MGSVRVVLLIFTFFCQFTVQEFKRRRFCCTLLVYDGCSFEHMFDCKKTVPIRGHGLNLQNDNSQKSPNKTQLARHIVEPLDEIVRRY